MPQRNDLVIEATIGAICGLNRRKYAVCHLDGQTAETFGFNPNETITFSMKYWNGDQQPAKGQNVRLEKVTSYAKGWRAFSASPIIATRKKKGKNKDA